MNEIKKQDLEDEAKYAASQAEKKKRIIIKTVIVVISVVVILFVVMLILQKCSTDMKENRQYSYDPLSEDHGEGFFEADLNYKVSSDADYMEKDRGVFYLYDGLGEYYTYEEREKATAQVRLFLDYFNAAVNGDGKTLNSLFTDDYFENNGRPIKKYDDVFPQQKIYGIKITLMGTKYTENTLEGVLVKENYQVSFLIKDNNGKFRPDIPEPDDGTVPVVFEVLTIKNESKINHIYLMNYGRSE